MQTGNADQVLPPDERKIRAINQATVVDQQLVSATSWFTVARFGFRRQFLRYFWGKPPLWRILLRMRALNQRMVPTFASLGAPRSGTTLLSDYIMQHPCVVLPLAKEIGASGVAAFRLITAQFPTLREAAKVEREYGTAITGYCTPIIPSLMFPFTAMAVTRQLKFIILLRNPVDRTYSHWRWDTFVCARLLEDPLWAFRPDFAEVARVELEAARWMAGSGLTLVTGANCGGYLQHSIYLPFLKLLFRHYDKSNAIFINSDDFFSDRIATAKRIYGFLGLPEYDPVELPVRNASPSGKMPQETRQMLVEFFDPLNRELYEYIGEDFGWR